MQYIYTLGKESKPTTRKEMFEDALIKYFSGQYDQLTLDSVKGGEIVAAGRRETVPLNGAVSVSKCRGM